MPRCTTPARRAARPASARPAGAGRQVALSVQHRLRLARGAARERDQAGVCRRQLDRRGGLGREQGLVGHEQHRDCICIRAHPRKRRLQLGAVALVGEDQRGLRHASRRRRSFARSCSVHGSTTAPMRKQAHIAMHPLGAVADQRHHHIAPGRSRAPAACRPDARCARSPRRMSTRAASRRCASSTSASPDGGSWSRTSLAKFMPVFSLGQSRKRPWSANKHGRSRPPYTAQI